MLMFDQGRLRGMDADYYGRVSDPSQVAGEGLTRQAEAMKWASEELGLVLKDIYQDPGRSGWTGAHRKRGQWKVYLDKVENKRFRGKRALVVEWFDRMGREDVIEFALPQFLMLIKAGIVICTYVDKTIYDQEILSSPLGPIMLQQSIMLMTLANVDSTGKSNRRRNTNRMTRERGDFLNGFTPGRWLKRKHPGEIPEAPWADWGHDEFFVNEVRASVVRLIFDLYLDERLGIRKVAHELNRRGIPTFGDDYNYKWRDNITGNWTGASVRTVLTSQSARGCYDPGEWVDGGRNDDGERLPPKHHRGDHLQEDRLPRLIVDTRWYATKLELAKNKVGGGGHPSLFPNLFCKGLCRCGHCNGTAYYAPESKTHGQFLVCGTYRDYSRDGTNKHGCNHALNYPLPVLEDQVFGVIQFMMQQEPTIEPTDEDERLVDLQKKLAEMYDHLHELMDYKSGRPFQKSAISKLERDIEKHELMIAERQPSSTRRLQEMIDLRAKSNLLPLEAPEQKVMRSRLIYELTQVIDKIKLYSADQEPKKRVADRSVEIYWKPQKSEADRTLQLVFKWRLLHLNSSVPARFDGVFIIDPHTGKQLEGPLSVSEADQSMLHELTARIVGNPKLQERRAQAEYVRTVRGYWQAHMRVPTSLQKIMGKLTRSWDTLVQDNGTERNKQRAMKLAGPHIGKWRQEFDEVKRLHNL